MSTAVRLEPSWLARVGAEFEQPRMRALADFLRAEKRRGRTIHPPGSRIFAALDATPFEQVKVVVIGQCQTHLEMSPA